MYAFAQRGDAHVVDEPLYAHFLRETGEDRPYRDDVMRAQDNDGNAVVRDVVLGDPDGAAGKSVRFYKHMAKQLVGDGFDRSFLARTKNVILVRHPRDILLSYHRALGEARMEDTGLEEMVALLNDGGVDAPAHVWRRCGLALFCGAEVSQWPRKKDDAEPREFDLRLKLGAGFAKERLKEHAKGDLWALGGATALDASRGWTALAEAALFCLRRGSTPTAGGTGPPSEFSSKSGAPRAGGRGC